VAILSGLSGLGNTESLSSITDACLEDFGTLIYLVSPASDYLTGRVIFLGGGWMAS